MRADFRSVPAQRRATDVEENTEPADVADTPHRHPRLRVLAGEHSAPRWRYASAIEAARRISPRGGNRPAETSG